MQYVVKYLSAGEVATSHVEASDAAAAVAAVAQDRDRASGFELLSVIPLAASDSPTDAIAAP